MSTTLAKPSALKRALSHLLPGENGSAPGVIAWSSFFFAMLQSICTFFAAMEGLRLAIGISSLAVSAGVGTAMDRFHQDWIRVPMMALALLGSTLNLAILLQLRYLRKRPASQWRQRPLSPNKIRMERVQMLLSLATLLLIAVEEFLHHHWTGHL
jgi:membrane protein YdbS with pleckstrin-like domain